MEVQIEKTSSYLCKVSIVIPADAVDEAFNRAFRKLMKTVELPGFRRGKVPLSLVERQYGDRVSQDVQSELVETSLFKALEERDVAPVATPRVTLGHLHRGSAFSYSAEVEFRPDIALQKYDGLAAPTVDNQIAPDAVGNELETMRKQAAQTVPILTRDTVQDGDVVLMDYEGFLDGEAFAGGRADNALIDIGGDGYIPGFSEGLLGAQVPGERTITVTFPADYTATELAGKDAQFQVRLKELKTRELPQLDDEFAKDMGEDSLEDLTAKITANLQASKDRDTEADRRKVLLQSLIDANPFEVPPSMLESQAERLVAGAHARVERMMGQRLPMNPEQMASLRQSSLADAEFQVRSGLLLMAVAKQVDIQASDAEVAQEVETMAAQAGEHADRMRTFYDDPERREELRFRLLEDKVVRYLLDHAVVAAPAA